VSRLTHSIIVGVVIAAAVGFLWLVRGVLTPFVLAAVGAYLLHPLVDNLERQGVGRVWAILGVYVLVGLILLAVTLMLVPVILEETQRISADFPEYRRQVLTLFSQIEQTYSRVDIPESLKQWPEDALRALQQRLPDFVQATINAVVGSVNTLITVLMSAFLAFYLLKDWKEFSEGLLGLIPEDWQELTRMWACRVDRVLSGYIRGQLVIALVVGVVTGVTLALLQMRYAFIVAIAAGIGNLVPYVGPIVGGGLGLLLAGFQSWVMVVKVGAVFLVVQQLEGSILSPNVMKVSVGVHPFWVIFSLFAGGAILGFWGVVVAVPLAALLKETVKVYRETFEVES
jgi:predicted PurR-regulated permease PerM